MTQTASPTRALHRGVRQHYEHASGRRQTVCTTAVLAYLRVDMSRVRYSDNTNDVKRHLRNAGYAVRSRMSKLPKNATVGQARAALAKLGACEGVHYYLGVEGHAMLLDSQGRTVVDTDPRQRDRRRVRHVSAVAPSYLL